MLKKNNYLMMITLLIGALHWPVLGWTDQVNFASSQASSQLFQIPLGARGVGLGEAMTAAGQGVEALNWNPAGLLNGIQHQVLSDYLALTGGINIGTLGYAYNDSWWAVGTWLTYANYGQIEKFGLTANGFPIRNDETFSPNSWLGIVGLSGEVSPGLMVGISGKFLYEDMVAKQWSVLSTDVGLLIETAFTNMQAAAVIKNIGQNVGRYAPPTTTQLGLVWQQHVGLLEQDNLLLALDAILTEAQSVQLAAGLEFDMLDMVTARLGYHSSELLEDKEFLSGFSGGLSFRYTNYVLHYAFSPDATIGGSHRITFEAYFGTMAATTEKGSYQRHNKRTTQPSQQQDKGYLLKYLK